MPPRNPRPTLEQATLKKRSARYVVEIRDATGVSSHCRRVDGQRAQGGSVSDSEGSRFKPAAPAKRQGNKTRSGDRAPSAKAPQKT
jgi:hypothetical protein